MPAPTSAAVDGARGDAGLAGPSPSTAAPDRQRRPLAAYAAGLLLLVLIAAYALTAGRLALYRHWNLESQALDMGYADQITWNNLHGNFFRFTVFRGAVGHEQGRPLAFGQGADPDSLLAYHVELLFLPLAVLYLIHAGPETLIVLLTAVLALGALPAYWIAHRQLDHRGAALAFAAMYLLSPATQAANLSDFHIVSMTGAMLLFAWYFLLRGQIWAFVLMAGLCTLAKEEVGLIVGLMGLYAAFVLRRWLLGSAVAILAFAWVALSFGVIIPYFSGGRASLFITRYAEAIALLRAYPGELLAGNLGWPVPGWTVTYLQHLLASSGVFALLGTTSVGHFRAGPRHQRLVELHLATRRWRPLFGRSDPRPARRGDLRHGLAGSAGAALAPAATRRRGTRACSHRVEHGRDGKPPGRHPATGQAVRVAKRRSPCGPPRTAPGADSGRRSSVGPIQRVPAPLAAREDLRLPDH